MHLLWVCATAGPRGSAPGLERAAPYGAWPFAPGCLHPVPGVKPEQKAPLRTELSARGGEQLASSNTLAAPLTAIDLAFRDELQRGSSPTHEKCRRVAARSVPGWCYDREMTSACGIESRRVLGRLPRAGGRASSPRASAHTFFTVLMSCHLWSADRRRSPNTAGSGPGPQIIVPFENLGLL